MKRHLFHFAVAIVAGLAGILVYLMAAPQRSPLQAEHNNPPVPLAAGVTLCKSSTVYYAKKNGYTESGEGAVDPSCSQWQLELQKAVENNDLEAARNALAHGANPSSPSDAYYLNYALPSAARIGNLDMVRLLLDNGADIDFQQCCCMSCYAPLTHAVDTGNLGLVRLLVARGANVDFPIAYDDGMTLRERARKTGHREIIELLDEVHPTSWRHRAEKRLVHLLHGDVIGHHYYFEN